MLVCAVVNYHAAGNKKNQLQQLDLLFGHIPVISFPDLDNPIS
jgi:hypothetical protein